MSDFRDVNILEDSYIDKKDTEQTYDWAIVPDKNKHEYIIGIDFGHGETSAAYCSIGWGIAIGELKDPIDVDFGSNRKVIPSAINIMPDGQVYIGESAFSPERLKKADVEVCFKKKPENIDGEKEQLMIRFMHEVYKLIRERVGASLTNENHLVYIATPSGWKDEGTINLYGQMARKAGLPIAGITTESRAAFINAQQDVSSGLPQYVNQGAIVFDMGSSTLDFTYLKEGSRPIDFGYDCGASRVEKIMYEDIRNHNEDIRSFLNSLELTPKTKAHYLSVLNSFYNYMIFNGNIKVNPCNGIKSPKLEKKLPNYLTIEEIDKLLDIKLLKPIDYRNKAMLEVLFATGTRISELINLTLNQIDFDECIIRVLGKGKKDRIIPLGNTAIEYLKLYINEYRPFILKTKNSEYVFVNKNGTKMSRQGFFKILKKLVKEAGIEKDVSPHTLRHSFATYLLNNGADLRVIQELLGHENLVTTEIYSHLSNKKIEEDYSHHPRAHKEKGID